MPNAIFIAQIDDGSWDQDLPISVLPAELIEAKELWERGDEKALQLVSRFLRCSFVPIGLNVDVNDLLGVSHRQSLGLPEPDESAHSVLERFGNLTPGDFAAVTRQHRFRPIGTVPALIAALEAECRIKKDSRTPVGFL